MRNAVRMTGVGPTVRAPVSAVGADTRDVLEEIGLDVDAIAALRRSGALGASGEDPS